MNDYNRGALPDPCLRLDYGFGEEWASVELGDGTGYVRLADYKMVKAENVKLRELAKAAWGCVKRQVSCDECRMVCCGCMLQSAMRGLGIEVEE